MQSVINQGKSVHLLNNSNITMPKSMYVDKNFSKELKIDSHTMTESMGYSLIKSLFQQHPLINTWLVLSSISICFLSIVFFIQP